MADGVGDSALFQKMRRQAEEAEAEEKARVAQEKAQEEADQDWEALRDPQGRLYYYNSKSRETAWELPTDTGAAAAEQKSLSPPPELAQVRKQPPSLSPVPTGAAPTPGSPLDGMASAALSQAVATIQQLTKDVSEQHRLREQLEEQLAQSGQAGGTGALKEITDKSVVLLKEKKAAEGALDEVKQQLQEQQAAAAEERALREQAEAGLAAAESDAGAGADELRERMQALVKEQRQAAEQRDAANAKVSDLEAEATKLGKMASSPGKLAQMWKQIDDDDSGELDALVSK